MANPRAKCEICSRRHRPDRGCVIRHSGTDRGSQGIPLLSIATIALDLTLLKVKLDRSEEKLDRMENASQENPEGAEGR